MVVGLALGDRRRRSARRRRLRRLPDVTGRVRHRPDRQPGRDRRADHPHARAGSASARSRSTATATLDARHVVEADVALRIGPESPSESYLRIDRVLDAARASGAQAVHPGYGFLSENAAFADAVGVGRPHVHRSAGVGHRSDGRQDPGQDRGGRGRRAGRARPGPARPDRCRSGRGGGLDRLPGAPEAVGRWRRQGHAAGPPARGPAGRGRGRAARGGRRLRRRHAVHRAVRRPHPATSRCRCSPTGTAPWWRLGERECSLQRRHQKIVEEAPSPLLSDAQRAAMADQAVVTARACGYVNAGTVEFIVSADRPDEFFFMEMNTRLQVEHPVTELVWGVDLVELQLRVAAGEHLPFGQADLVADRATPIEARVYAEDPVGRVPAVVRAIAGPARASRPRCPRRLVAEPGDRGRLHLRPDAGQDHRPRARPGHRAGSARPGPRRHGRARRAHQPRLPARPPPPPRRGGRAARHRAGRAGGSTACRRGRPRAWSSPRPR